MAGQTLRQPLWRVSIGDSADDQCAKANDFDAMQADPGLRRVRLLVTEGVTDQEPVKLDAAAGETVKEMIAADALDPKSIRHPGSAASKADGSSNRRRNRGTSRGGASSAPMKAAHCS